MASKGVCLAALVTMAMLAGCQKHSTSNANYGKGASGVATPSVSQTQTSPYGAPRETAAPLPGATPTATKPVVTPTPLAPTTGSASE